MQVKNLVLALALGVVSFLSSGCGVYMAFTQPPSVDITALEAGGGWSRVAVIDKLGPPVSSVRNEDGTRTEIYQGRSDLFPVGDVL